MTLDVDLVNVKLWVERAYYLYIEIARLKLYTMYETVLLISLKGENDIMLG